MQMIWPALHQTKIMLYMETDVIGKAFETERETSTINIYNFFPENIIFRGNQNHPCVLPPSSFHHHLKFILSRISCSSPGYSWNDNAAWVLNSNQSFNQLITSLITIYDKKNTLFMEVTIHSICICELSIKI